MGMEDFVVLWVWGFFGIPTSFCGYGMVWGLKSNPTAAVAYLRLYRSRHYMQGIMFFLYAILNIFASQNGDGYKNSENL